MKYARFFCAFVVVAALEPTLAEDNEDFAEGLVNLSVEMLTTLVNALGATLADGSLDGLSRAYSFVCVLAAILFAEECVMMAIIYRLFRRSNTWCKATVAFVYVAAEASVAFLVYRFISGGDILFWCVTMIVYETIIIGMSGCPRAAVDVLMFLLRYLIRYGTVRGTETASGPNAATLVRPPVPA